MTTYHPDNWVIIQITNDGETLYKVLAGWSGGYLHGNSWKLNSGITRIESDDRFYYFYGHSGSVYKCSKSSECLRMNTAGVWNHFKTTYPDNVELISVVDMLPSFIVTDHIEVGDAE